MVGGAAGSGHSVVFTEAGELFTFGYGGSGALGHGGGDNESVPRLVKGELAGTKVVGAAAVDIHVLPITVHCTPKVQLLDNAPFRKSGWFVLHFDLENQLDGYIFQTNLPAIYLRQHW